MKDILKSVLIAIFAVPLAVSCQKNDKDLTLQEFALRTDTNGITVEVYDDAVAFTLEWDAISLGGETDYFIEFAQDSDVEFTSSVTMNAGKETSATITFKDLETINNTIGAVSDYTLAARIRAEGEGYRQSISNKVMVQVELNILPVIENLYVLGAACDAGWSLGAMDEMASEDGIFTWTGHLKAEDPDAGIGGIRFNTTNQDWFPALIPGDTPGTLIYVAGETDDYKELTVDVSGTYYIEINAKSAKDMTYTCELIKMD